MSGITTGVGIFSGIDSRSLIDQLLAIEARPKALAQSRIVQIKQQQAAYLDINSALLNLKNIAGSFDQDKVFRSTSASSSNDDVLTATASTNAQAGSYSFSVKRLVSTQQHLSRGFVDRDTSALGASEFTFEIGGGGLATDTRLSELNGGAGVERGTIEVRDSSGDVAEIDLSTAVTVRDVLDAFNSSSGVSVKATVEGDTLRIEDTAGGAGELVISDTFGSETATGLGIAGTAAGGVIDGADIRTLSTQSALSLLNDGNGVHIRDGGADFRITARDGTIYNIDLGEREAQATDPDTGEPLTDEDGDPIFEVTHTRATTLQDVIDRIEEDTGGHITASLSPDGKALVITDTVGGGSDLIIENSTGRTTADDLGIATPGTAADSVTGTRLISGLNTSLVRNLNGGAGISATDLEVTDRAGNSTTVSIDPAVLDGSVAELIDEINSQLSGAGVNVTVGLNRAGNGLALTDSSGGAGDLVVGGGAASELGLETAGASANYFDGANVQKKWISNATKLDDLNVGQGIGTGSFRITDASGATAVVEVGENQKTVDDLIALINSRPVGVTASINDRGDGIVITDSTGQEGTLKIESVSGSVARNLNLIGEDDDSSDGLAIDGSYERTVSFEETDTLEDVAEKINLESVGVSATVINDGSGTSPYRLSLTSSFSGSVGRAVIDTKGYDLGLNELSRGNDAVVFFGGDDAASSVLLTSSTNTLDNVVQGVTIDLKSASEEPVELTVSRDSEKIEEAVNEFVEAYNGVLDTIDQYTQYDEETNTRGALLGDSTTSQIERSLLSMVQGEAIGVEGQFQRLFQVGVRIGEGARLEFDRERFRNAMEEDPQNVADLFGANRLAPSEPEEIFPGVTVQPTEDEFSRLGVAEQLKQLAENLTNSVDGLLTNRSRALDSQIELQEERIERIDASLATKRAKLEREFVAMEQTIAQLQSQQAALGSLAGLG